MACNAPGARPGQLDLRQAQEAQLAVECHHLQPKAVSPVAQVATVLQRQWALLDHHLCISTFAVGGESSQLQWRPWSHALLLPPRQHCEHHHVGASGCTFSSSRRSRVRCAVIWIVNTTGNDGQLDSISCVSKA